MKKYKGFIPPCGIYCGGCYRYKSGKKNECLGAETHCKTRKCKSIYMCCVEKKGLNYCYECNNFPCSRFKKFAESWKKYGQDLIENQMLLEQYGEEKWLQQMLGKNRISTEE
ncbi:DUF3795 domain-containing protein [Vallitalea pronyensis]|uniref:DUF3795 domain-containing protein n=1 Tax=Vallitalea pronyensis TaxID=1348613 RepID=A0A8J8MIW3_9FIRM|nr:DUF3795 domain-containing protein [Vallitalea pronyensis]QUI22073.1 DUF3795 domain-containing protein [Vallitalea pronyensis]